MHDPYKLYLVVKGSESQWEKQGSNRSSSDPVPPLNVSQNASQDSIKDAGHNKSRPMSDPVSKQDFEHHCFQQEENCSSSSGKSTSEPSTTVSPEPLYDTPRNLLRDRSQGQQKFRRMSDPVSIPDFSLIMGYGAQQEEVTSSSDKSTSESSTTVSPEPLYDTPRNLLDDWRQGDEKTRRMSELVSKLDLCHIKNYCSQQEESISDPVYEEYPFSVIKERCSSVDSSDNEDENQNEEEASFYVMMEPVYEELNKVQQGNDAIQALPSDTVDESQYPAPPAEKAKVSQADIALNRAKSRALLSSRSEPQNHSSDRRTADVKEIYVNQNDLKTHLTLEDLNGKPCVSHWPALPETVCQFRKGDQILAINDLHTESVEDVQTYLKKLLKDQVKLTVLRQPGSEAFLRSRWGTE
ncbi:hypothetical protein SKAU_G00140210 [Synaphobranchus kaupii]|uniref:PDZ domain-containing protein n=1 Tax=Synaphobranchus kaupii TaxID=118154 RepID=A0A9Q1FT07_SYNKA|nr:hypothetical protein SKAU_G00140210 [Synaphobranchus kaupii]